MNCKFCDELLEEGVTVCPACGKEQEETEDFEIEVEETEDELVEETEEVDEIEEDEDEVDQPVRTSWWQLVLCAIGGLALLGVLAFAVLKGMGIHVHLPRNNVYRKAAYTVTTENAAEASDVVVAKVGDMELTNGELQIYYWNLVDQYVSSYGTYFFNPLQPLEDQVYDETTGQTWQQYLLEEALNTWHRYASVCLLAKEAGYEPSEEMVASMELLPTDLETMAAQYEMASVDELIAQWYGATCSYRHLESYMYTSYYAMEYLNVLAVQLAPTDQEIETYYYMNEAQLAEKGVSKDSGLSASVRHILICPEGGTLSEDGYSMVYSEAEWAAAKAQADAILAQWKEGDATEESFIALVAEYTHDTGSATTGGLYEDITPTASYVEEFRNWATSAFRTPGETAIVQTMYGYHIMYYVSGVEVWKEYCREDLVSQRFNALIEETMEENPIKATYRKMAIFDIYAPTVTDPTDATDAAGTTDDVTTDDVTTDDVTTGTASGDNGSSDAATETSTAE